jgi:hypothetical protein
VIIAALELPEPVSNYVFVMKRGVVRLDQRDRYTAAHRYRLLNPTLHKSVFLPINVNNYYWFVSYLGAERGQQRTSIQCTTRLAAKRALRNMTTVLEKRSVDINAIADSQILLPESQAPLLADGQQR